MHDTPPGRLSIGPFARLTGLSLKAVRLYAQLGLLAPAYVDPATGYRYYTTDQLRPARLIGLLRRMDMPLSTIRQVVTASPAAAEALVQGHIAALDERLALARRLADELTPFLYKEIPLMAHDVTVRTIPPQPILSRTARVKVDRLEGFISESVAALRAAAQAGGIAPAGAPFGLYHGPINADEDGPIEVCLPVTRLPAATGDLTARELPGSRVASVTLTGDQCAFPAILGGYDAVYDWIEKNGYQHTDSPREIWHTLPGEGSGERLEVAWPFAERAAG
jgi:DNA-binding transcriptional MerR regulator